MIPFGVLFRMDAEAERSGLLKPEEKVTIPIDITNGCVLV